MSEIVLSPMTTDEARQCVNDINSGLITIRSRLLDMYEREGWKALGYASWRDCAMKEFNFNQSRVYQLLSAAEIERNISTIVENEQPIPESHLRPLSGLEPKKQIEVWQEAQVTAPSGKVTAAHVEAVAAQHRTPPPQPAKHANPEPARTFDAAIPAFTPPVERRPSPPIDRPLTDNEVEAVIWRAIAHHAKSGTVQHRLAWLQTADVGDFSRLLNPGVSFEAAQMERVRCKVEAELNKQVAPITVPVPYTQQLRKVEAELRKQATPSESRPAPSPAIDPELEDSDEYYTPPYIIEAARKTLGAIDLDPASCVKAQRVVKADAFFTKQDNGLESPWFGRIWLNPPFSNPAPFTTKLIDEYEAKRVTAAILLVNNGTETKWGQALLRRYPVCFVGAHEDRGSRISFWKHDPDEPKAGNRYAQMIFFLGDYTQTFASVFSQFGVIKV